MDTSITMDPLNDSTLLPELSFDDLLDDDSPVKKIDDESIDDPLALDFEEKIRKEDDTLNTPGPKRPPPPLTKLSTKLITPTTMPALIMTTKSSDDRMSTVKAALAATTKLASTTVTLVSSKKNFQKIAPKPITTTTTTITTTTTTTTTTTKVASTTAQQSTTSTSAISAAPIVSTTIGGTAIRTANGQILYIKNNSSGMAAIRLQSRASSIIGSLMRTPTTSVAAAENVKPALTATTATTLGTSTNKISTSITPRAVTAALAAAAGVTTTKAVTAVTALTALAAVTAALTTAAGQVTTKPVTTANTTIGKAKTAVSLSSSSSSTTLPTNFVITASGGQVLKKAPIKTTAVATTTTTITTITKTAVNLASSSTTLSTAASTNVTNKTVSIQVIRSSDGKLLPIKATGTAIAKTAVSLSTSSTTMSTNFAGRKIITASGGQVLIKAPIKTNAVATTTTTLTPTPTLTTTPTPAPTPTPTLVKPIVVTSAEPMKTVRVQKLTSSTATTSAGLSKTTVSSPGATGKIVLQNSSGKKIFVSNNQFIKLSPKSFTSTSGIGGGGGGTTTTVTSLTPTTTTTTTKSSTAGKIQAIKIPGKSGIQYVRMLPNSRFAVPISTAAAAAAGSVSTAPTATGMPRTAMRVINALPAHKFTVVRPSASTKVMLTPKKDSSGMAMGVPVTFSPVHSKVQKTLFPTLDGKSSTNYISGGSVNIVRKHKLSETVDGSGNVTGDGPPEAKKSAVGTSRFVVMSRSMINNSNLPSSVQQRAGAVQRIPVTSSSATTANINVIKSVTGEKKLFSVLKNAKSNNSGGSGSGSGSITTNTHSRAEIKSLIICGKAQALMAQQQQHKTMQHAQEKANQMKDELRKEQEESRAQLQADLKAAAVRYPKKFVYVNHKDDNSNSNKSNNSNSNKSNNSNSNKSNNSNSNKSNNSNSNKSNSNNSNSNINSNNNDLPVKVKLEPLDDKDAQGEEGIGGVRRKHCNCSKSQCLKLYCDCFANGEFCQDCTCKDCFNNLQYEDERQRAIRNCLDRNPSAFKPKITTAHEQGDMRLHNKGCNCKRSGCLKNYCECYEAKIPCSSNCKCVGCRNIEERPDLDMDPIDPQILATIVANTEPTKHVNNASSAGQGVKRKYDAVHRHNQTNEKTFKGMTPTKQQFGIKHEFGDGGNSNSSFGSIGPYAAAPAAHYVSTHAQTPTHKQHKPQQNKYITREVIDATIQCMISQADECQKTSLPSYQTEKLIMEELGRCLVEIIDFSIRNTETSFMQD